MKTVIVIGFLILSQVSSAQNDPRSSSKSAAQYDASSIDENIAHDRDMMYFSQLAIDRGTIADTKDAARDMLADFTALLYSMEQLATAGGKGERAAANDAAQEAKNLNEQLAISRGFTFDTAWIGGILRMHQLNIDRLTVQKSNATNERLKAAVTEAIPVVKKYVTRLNSLQKQLVRRDLQEKKQAAKDAAMEAKKKK